MLFYLERPRTNSNTSSILVALNRTEKIHINSTLSSVTEMASSKRHKSKSSMNNWQVSVPAKQPRVYSWEVHEGR